MTTMMTLAQAHALLPGSTLVGDGRTNVVRVHTDTRTLRTGDLFVALRGERFDAHRFLPQAREAGAVAAIAESGLAEAGLPGLIVPDTLAALGRLATAWRRGFELPFIAVTGSNGKTTVTQMIANVLRAWVDAAAFSTEGNFNNDIGVPLTLLRLRESHRAGVVELGMNHPGEIAALAAMAAPTVVLVNNAQREHQEFMASVEAVARENGSAIDALPPTGVAVFPADDAMAPIWQQLAGGRPVLTFALTGAADVTCEAQGTGDGWAMDLHTPAGSATLRLSMAGRHNLRNAMAAAACALAAGCPLSSVVIGLESFKPVKGRSQLHRLSRGFHGDADPVTLIDDSYNANPDSVRAAVDVLTELPGPRWLVLGDMGEVGDQGPAFHAEVGAYAAEHRIDALWTVGSATEATAAAYAGRGESRHFASVAALIASLHEAPVAASVLVKGSRFMKTEQVVAALVAKAGSTAASTNAPAVTAMSTSTAPSANATVTTTGGAHAA